MTAQNPNAVYACINNSDTYVPEENSSQSICIRENIADALEELADALEELKEDVKKDQER